MKDRVNVPGFSVRALQNKIQQKGFQRDAAIKEEILDSIAAANPGGRCWIKADGCDVQNGLCESIRHQWSGDTDLEDGSLNALYAKYMDRRLSISNLGLAERALTMTDDLVQLVTELEGDKLFLVQGEKEAKDVYNKKLEQRNVPKEALFALAWEVEGY